MSKEHQRTRVLVNALAMHAARDAARVFLENLLDELPRAWPEAELVVLARDGTRLPAEERFAVIRVRMPTSGIARVLHDLVRLPLIVKRVSPHVVISPNESLSRRLKPPVVVVAQNLLFFCDGVGPLPTGPLLARLRSRLQFAFYRRQMPRAYERADLVVTVSRHAATQLARLAGLDLERVRVVPYGADRLRTKSRLPDRTPLRLVIVGAVAHYKRLDIAVRALALLRAGGGDYELVLAGEEWPGYGAAIDDAARVAGIGEHVKRVGALGGDELADLFARAHATIALSTCESFGIPVTEAMRAGVPAVVADEPWSAETVGDAAVRVDGSNPRAVAEAIRTLESEGEWRRRAAEGRLAVAGYTWAANAAGIVAAAKEAAGGPAAAH